MDLVALESIRRLKHRYLRCVDLKLWDELGDTFTEDATADYGTPVYGSPLKFNGRAEIVAFMRDKLGGENEDRYLRVNDVWRIAHTGYVRNYEAVMSLDDLPSFRLTANRWAGAHTG